MIDLCGALASHGHEVTLLTSDAGQAPLAWQAAGARTPHVVVLPPARLPAWTYLGEALQMFHAFVQSHDLVHVHGMWEFGNVQICSIASRYARPYVISVHGMLDPWSLSQAPLKKQVYLETFGKPWLRGASRIHLTVQSELEAGVKFFPREAGRVVPLLMDLEGYRQLPGPDIANAKLAGQADRPRILFLSRLHAKKGLEILLQAVRVLAERGRDVALVIAGDGDAGYVEQLKSSANDLADRAIFLGMVGGALKLSVYQACDVFALPTQQENFGLVFVEALGCGLPVVTSNEVGSRAELESSDAVTFVERTPEQFAAAIERLLLDKNRATQIGQRGRQWVLNTFDPAISVRRFESFYADALGDSGARPKPAAMSSLSA